MSQMYFTADTHLGHTRIIEYDQRPFSSVQEMDDTIIDNINSLVKKEDTLFFLGDFALPFFQRLGGNQKKKEMIAEYRHRIQCENIVLVYGNHDKLIRKNIELQNLFKGCYDLLERKLPLPYGENGGTQRITLCHYAMRVWNKSHHGSWHLHGHSHHTLKSDPHSLSLDVGINGWDYKPISIDQIQVRMGWKEWKAIDHHGERIKDYAH